MIARAAFALALALAALGYAVQGRPGLPGAAGQGIALVGPDPVAWVELRKRFYGPLPGKSAAWLVPADALAMHGQYADAAGFLAGAMERNPDDAEVWLSLANALFGHADGRMTPAAGYAYRRAIVAGPADPAPPFFYARALEASGERAAADRIRAAAPGPPPSAIAGGQPCC
jgi:cytochrome c-type biogenesis protein CcmH